MLRTKWQDQLAQVRSTLFGSAHPRRQRCRTSTVDALVRCAVEANTRSNQHHNSVTVTLPQ